MKNSLKFFWYNFSKKTEIIPYVKAILLFGIIPLLLIPACSGSSSSSLDVPWTGCYECHSDLAQLELVADPDNSSGDTTGGET